MHVCKGLLIGKLLSGGQEVLKCQTKSLFCIGHSRSTSKTKNIIHPDFNMPSGQFMIYTEFVF